MEKGSMELVDVVGGLADDAEAVVNGCTEPWSNGMVERFVNKVKWIKRSSYGQAGFPLLQRRVRLASPFQTGTSRRRKCLLLKDLVGFVLYVIARTQSCMMLGKGGQFS